MAFTEIRSLGHLNFKNLFKLKLAQRLAVWKSRRSLAQLDARALEDIGITADKAAEEARLGLWDVPANWRHH